MDQELISKQIKCCQFTAAADSAAFPILTSSTLYTHTLFSPALDSKETFYYCIVLTSLHFPTNRLGAALSLITLFAFL